MKATTSLAKLTRRHWLGASVAALLGTAGAAFGRFTRRLPGVRLRPPGALPEGQFVDACVRCLKCGNACPNGCIRFHGFDAGLTQALTPYIRARERACVLCGECARVCPTSALQPFEATREGWLEDVKMGTAHVNTSMCYSYHGRTCGACYKACPLAGLAIRIGVFEKPLLQPEYCVGCGLCEQACLHLPQAIRVFPGARVGLSKEHGAVS
ncbi:MAG: 4Fe-4S dicluster domain-containing protein [Proteobacteria bacterium]|nr:4Fe-4S dicluster domain-containing protein [Pseudomonadota bacterium]